MTGAIGASASAVMRIGPTSEAVPSSASCMGSTTLLYALIDLQGMTARPRASTRKPKVVLLSRSARVQRQTAHCHQKAGLTNQVKGDTCAGMEK